jgi:hypothetical protein
MLLLFTHFMPFTLSHAVLAPPLSSLSGNRLPVAALAIGCMVPDLYRLFTQHNSNTTHLWSSLIHPDLWIGLAFCAIWYLLYRPAIYRFIGIRHGLDITSFLSLFKFFTGVCLALILGTATHLIWDGLTHVDFRSFAFQDFLSQQWSIAGHPYPLHRILQIGMSFLALPFIVWMSWHYYQSHRQEWAVSRSIRIFAWGLMAIALITGLSSVWDYMRYIPDQVWQSDLYYFTGRSINEFSQGFLIVFSLGCLLFLFLDRDQGMGE